MLCRFTLRAYFKVGEEAGLSPEVKAYLWGLTRLFEVSLVEFAHLFRIRQSARQVVYEHLRGWFNWVSDGIASLL